MTRLFAQRTLLNLPGTIDEIADRINDANEEISLCYSNNPNHSPKVWLEAPNCYTDTAMSVIGILAAPFNRQFEKQRYIR